MQYNEIYNICQPVMDWLKEHYPNNHKIVISTNGAEMIECSKLNVLDKSLKAKLFQNSIMPKEYENEIQDILNVDASEIQDDTHRFGIEMLQKLFNCNSENSQKNSEVSDHE